MEDLKVIFAANLIRLRLENHLTQAELGEKINYSDKSISKWERAESIPDVTVLKALGNLFGVSVDFLLESHTDWQPQTVEPTFSTGMVTAVAMMSIWTLAVLIFVIFWIMDMKVWLIFIVTIPLSLIILLVLNSLWYRRKNNIFIVAALVLSVFLLTYYLLRAYQPWQLIFVAILAEIIVYFSFHIKKGCGFFKKR